jgi:hypothetical protein
MTGKSGVASRSGSQFPQDPKMIQSRETASFANPLPWSAPLE